MSRKFVRNEILFVEILRDEHERIIELFEPTTRFYKYGMIFERMTYQESAIYRVTNKQMFALFCIKYGI
jgi:hypothetical protein